MATEKVRDARTLQLAAGLPTGEVRHPTHGPRLAWSMPLLVLVGFAESAPRTDGIGTESPPGTGGTALPPFRGMPSLQCRVCYSPLSPPDFGTAHPKDSDRCGQPKGCPLNATAAPIPKF